jgi:hypothetical protein
MVRGPAKRILPIFKAHAQREALTIPSKSLWVMIFSYLNGSILFSGPMVHTYLI